MTKCYECDSLGIIDFNEMSSWQGNDCYCEDEVELKDYDFTNKLFIDITYNLDIEGITGTAHWREPYAICPYCEGLSNG